MPPTEVPPRMMVYANQVAPGRAQKNPNVPNSKFQTYDPLAGVTYGIIAGKPRYIDKYDTTLVKVLVIDIDSLVKSQIFPILI